MSQSNEYRAACQKVAAHRAQVIDSLQATKERITPARLRADLRNKVVQSASDSVRRLQATVQERPVAAGAAGIALIAWLARRPLWTLLRRLFVGTTQEQDDQSTETDDG